MFLIDIFPQLAQPTLVDALRERSRLAPGELASVMVFPDRDPQMTTFAELLARADRFARAYRERAVGESRPLTAVCLYHGVELHAAFLGSMLAGQIPTIIAPPSPRMEKDKYIRSFVKMLDHVQPDLVVTDGLVLDELRKLEIDNLPDERLMDASLLGGPLPPGEIDCDAIRFDPATPDEIALLQHSSGTTGLQKGVALSHRAVLDQIRSYGRAIELSETDVIASWLPLYHDMGFIACFIMPLVTGTPIVEISPFDWVGQPALLPQVVGRFGATLCWLPNFAYSFMAKSIRESQMDQVDFSSIRAFVNCSEPVMASSHREFTEKFADRGVESSKLTTSYAMAENVFAVTQSPIGRHPRVHRISKETFELEHRAVDCAEGDSIELVSNGSPVEGVEVKIVDDRGDNCAERQVGEICIRGTSLFSGYFRRNDLTEESFLGDWYKTGDLGYLADGELYVTGRKKDLIIIQGRNFYPSDLESAVAEVEGVIKGRVVAFGATDEANGTESLILIAETDIVDAGEQGRVKLAIRKRIAQSFDCTVRGVHLVPPRWLIKSSSGKVARADNRKKFADDLRESGQ